MKKWEAVVIALLSLAVTVVWFMCEWEEYKRLRDEQKARKVSTPDGDN